jgi:NAD(P)-dependent dehydrogenase (short-subunit alcohol dehydrogenase family)
MFDCPQRQWKAYAMSKWGTAMLAVALNRMEKNVSAISIHPGVVQTGMIQALTRTHVSPAKNAGQPSRIHAKLSAIRARLRQRIASCVMLTPVRDTYVHIFSRHRYINEWNKIN